MEVNEILALKMYIHDLCPETDFPINRIYLNNLLAKELLQNIALHIGRLWASQLKSIDNVQYQRRSSLCGEAESKGAGWGSSTPDVNFKDEFNNLIILYHYLPH